jgi:hypothetical protein
MLKPTSNYRMSKQTKRDLAMGRWTSLDQRHAWKRSMIQAELASKIVVKPTKDRNSNGGGRSNSATSSTAE